MSADGKWTTQDGRRLDILWMDSVHLVHSMNMMLRKSAIDRAKAERIENVVFSPMRDELKRRYLWSWRPDNQLAIPHQRETLQELCMWRACVDCGAPYTWEFRHQPSGFTERMQGSQDSLHAQLIAKFVAYRLERS